MGTQAVQYPWNFADRRWTLAPGRLTRLFHGFGGGVCHASGSGDSRHVLSPIVAALQPDNRATALNWLHSFYGIGTVITVLVGTLAFRLGIGWRTISLTFIVVPLLVALGFLNVDLPPLISDKEGGRTPMRDLCRNPSFVVVNVAIFLGGALELGLAQWLPAYAEMSLGFSKWTGNISLLAFSAAMALGRIFAGLIGRRVDPIRLMLGCCWTSMVLFLLACFAPWPSRLSVVHGSWRSCIFIALALKFIWSHPTPPRP
jgi:fucose permease